MLYDTVIHGGTLVTPGGPVTADLGIVGEQIAAIGQGLSGTQMIDAAGKLVLPGAVDPHVHLQMPAGPVRSSDDFTTGTIAAACGGTTTVIDFVEPEPGTERAGLLAALAARRAEAEGSAVIDFSLHMTLMDARPATLAEIPAVVAAGCTSFKTYLTYAGFKLDDADFLSALAAVGKAGRPGPGPRRERCGHRLPAAQVPGRGPGRAALSSRAPGPAGLEAEAIERALALAQIAGCPLYVVHVSTGRGAAAVLRARAGAASPPTARPARSICC